jgi:hypothetical protein
LDAANIATIVDTAIDQHGFSGVVSLRHQDTVLYERAAGYADRSNQIANTLATRAPSFLPRSPSVNSSQPSN